MEATTLMELLDIGDLICLHATFTVEGAPTDPTTTSYAVRRPDGTLTVSTYPVGPIVRESVGAFFVDQPTDQRGRWWYRFTGTGAAEESQEGSFYVRVRHA